MATRLMLLVIPALLATLVDAGGDLCGDLNADSLVLTVVLFRHGARTPTKTYPTDPYQADFWKKIGGPGQLTATGKEQHYIFGKWVRKCYASFLPPNFNPNDLYVRCSDFDRTLQSVQAHLAGAYPPDGAAQVWSGTDQVDKIWQPIPIHTIPAEDEYLLIPDIACRPYDAMVADAWLTAPEIVAIQKQNEDLINFIAEKAGFPRENALFNVGRNLADIVYIERLMNLTLPTWMNQTVIDKLDAWRNLWMIAQLANDDMVKLAGGEFVRHLSDLLTNKARGSVPQKHIIFSAHDSTIGTLLAAFGNNDRAVPMYRAAVFTELHLNKTENRYFVKVFYRNSVEADPVLLDIRTCGKTCYVEDFVKALAPFQISNKREICRGDAPTTTAVPSTTTKNAAKTKGSSMVPVITVASTLATMFKF